MIDAIVIPAVASSAEVDRFRPLDRFQMLVLQHVEPEPAAADASIDLDAVVLDSLHIAAAFRTYHGDLLLLIP